MTIGSPAISSAGGSRSGLERGGELKVATERRRRRCAFGSKLRHVCWRGGASRPPGAIRVGYRLALASRLCCHGACGGSVWDAEPSRSERRGSESRLRVRALSARAVFAFTAVAPLLPTMTTVGSGVTIGSPAISSAGGSRSGLERGGELKVATERRRRRCAFGSKLRHVCWRGGASRPPGAIRVGYRLALASRRFATVLGGSQGATPSPLALSVEDRSQA